MGLKGIYWNWMVISFLLSCHFAKGSSGGWSRSKKIFNLYELTWGWTFNTSFHAMVYQGLFREMGRWMWWEFGKGSSKPWSWWLMIGINVVAINWAISMLLGIYLFLLGWNAGWNDSCVFVVHQNHILLIEYPFYWCFVSVLLTLLLVISIKFLVKP